MRALTPRFLNLPVAIILLGVALLAPALGDTCADDLISQVTARLVGSPTTRPATLSQAGRKTIEVILALPDPETFFDRYVYGIQRSAETLLTAEQRRSLDALLTSYEPLRTKWHDERNVLRCKFNEVAWHYIGASDEEAEPLYAELESWMKLRMEWTLRESMLYHELNARVWQLLDAQQRQNIIDGSWKAHAKRTTGHTRNDAAERNVRRALGIPAQETEFRRIAEAWKKERAPLHRRQQELENAARRIGFAMDLNDRTLVQRSVEQANAAYATLFLAEMRAMRRLAQTGYQDFKERSVTAAMEAWSEAPRRFKPGAADLIAVLERDAP